MRSNRGKAATGARAPGRLGLGSNRVRVRVRVRVRQ